MADTFQPFREHGVASVDQLTHRAYAAAVREVHEAAREVLDQAKRDAPRSGESGNDPHPDMTLAESGRIVENSFSPGQVSVVFDTPYATKQHEFDWYEHPHGGKAHYLSDPAKAMAARLGPRIAAAVRRAL